MSASWMINATLSAVLLLPLNLILLCALGLWLRRRWPRCGLALSVAALIVLTVLSTRMGGSLLVYPLEKMNPPLLAATAAGAQAIVVLGGGRISNAPEYGGQDIPGSIALQRLRYAAKLQRETGLPLLVSGGQPDGAPESEAAGMARVLRDDFSVPVKWQENMSNNTAENAQFSSQLLRAAGVRRILLVTDAMHMQRAKIAFQRAGLQVVPAATLFTSAVRITLPYFLPTSLHLTSYALHEWLGLGWYWVRHRHPAN